MTKEHQEAARAPASASKTSDRCKRSLILAASIDQFAEIGYENTRWAKVADEVGISEATLYYYFESKAHCLLTIMRLELARNLQRFREVTADVDDPAEALESAIAAAYDVSPREVLQARILQNHMAILATRRFSTQEDAERGTARQLMREIQQGWRGPVERGMERGTFARRDPHAVTTLLLAVVVSVWQWYRPDGPMTLGQVQELVTRASLRIVRT